MVAQWLQTVVPPLSDCQMTLCFCFPSGDMVEEAMVDMALAMPSCQAMVDMGN